MKDFGFFLFYKIMKLSKLFFKNHQIVHQAIPAAVLIQCFQNVFVSLCFGRVGELYEQHTHWTRLPTPTNYCSALPCRACIQPGTRAHLAQLQELPVVVDVAHQLHLRVKVLLLVDDAEVVQTQVGHVLPAADVCDFNKQSSASLLYVIAAWQRVA